MKKTIAILLILLLSISTLAGCGGAEEPQTTPPEETPVSVPELAPESETEQESEPEATADGMNTVEITDVKYGDIIFSYPDDGSVTVMIAEPGAEDDSLIPEDEFRELLGVITQSHYDVEYQKALIAGDDFNILVGYTNYFDSGSSLKTFGMVERTAMRHRGEPLTFDGLDGFIHTQSVTSISFPAITQIAGRVILLFPNSVDEDDDVGEISRSLFERADIQAFLSTLRFPGEILDEPRLETQPIDNEIFSITPSDGWEVTGMSFMWHTYELYKGDIRVTIETSGSRPPSYQIDDYLSDSNVYNDIELIENVTFNGQEFIVMHDEGWKLFVLVTSRGDEPLDIESEGYVMLVIQHADSLDDVTSLLNTIKVN